MEYPIKPPKYPMNKDVRANTVVFVIGPTSSGKTDMSIRIAKDFYGEIINIDSQQVYKDLNIGTGKITKAEMEGVKHHLFDKYSLNEDVNVYEYCVNAEDIIHKVQKQEKLPIVVGGTGLYCRVLSGGIELSKEKQISSSVLTKIERMSNVDVVKKSEKSLWYKNLDWSEQHNIQRLRRRLVKDLCTTGKSRSFLVGQSCLKIGLVPPSDIRIRIATRVRKMLKEGLISEVKLLRKKYSDEQVSKIKAIGYSQTLAYLEGSIASKSELSELISTKTYQYYKRQMTWLQREPNVHWVESYNEIFEKVKRYLSR